MLSARPSGPAAPPPQPTFYRRPPSRSGPRPLPLLYRPRQRLARWEYPRRPCRNPTPLVNPPHCPLRRGRCTLSRFWPSTSRPRKVPLYRPPPPPKRGLRGTPRRRHLRVFPPGNSRYPKESGLHPLSAPTTTPLSPLTLSDVKQKPATVRGYDASPKKGHPAVEHHSPKPRKGGAAEDPSGSFRSEGGKGV